MALLLAFFASILIAFNNLFMRRSIDAGGTTKAFLFIVQFFSFIVALLLGPMKSGHYTFNAPIACIGLFAGLLLGVMMWALGRSMEKGPPGLSVAFLNSSAVAPAIFMALIFGSRFGHSYAWWNAVGSILVLLGLFWASFTTTKEFKNPLKWVLLCLTAFWAHVCFLMILQWRAMLINPNMPQSSLLPFRLSFEDSQWFMPMIFVASTTFLFNLFLKSEKRLPSKKEALYGLYGGVCNGASTYFLVLAAQIATPVQNAVIFPLFAVCLIMACNTWGKALYKEHVHWRAMAFCIVGVFIGTMNWGLLFNQL